MNATKTYHYRTPANTQRMLIFGILSLIGFFGMGLLFPLFKAHFAPGARLLLYNVVFVAWIVLFITFLNYFADWVGLRVTIEPERLVFQQWHGLGIQKRETPWEQTAIVYRGTTGAIVIANAQELKIPSGITEYAELMEAIGARSRTDAAVTLDAATLQEIKSLMSKAGGIGQVNQLIQRKTGMDQKAAAYVALLINTDKSRIRK